MGLLGVLQIPALLLEMPSLAAVLTADLATLLEAFEALVPTLTTFVAGTIELSAESLLVRANLIRSMKVPLAEATHMLLDLVIIQIAHGV